MGTRFHNFQAIVSSMGDLPSSPLVASRLLELLRKSDTRMSELVATISLDQAVSARILRTANSVLYHQQRQVTTLERAIVVMGQDTLRNLVFESSLRTVKKTYGLLERRLWEQSLGAAVCCRFFARSLGSSDGEEAFLAGLIYHIGKTVMINRDKSLYQEVQRVVDDGEGDLRDVERALFAYSHDQVGAALLEHWNFPEHLILITRYHHEFSRLAETDPDVYTLCAILNLAGGCCRHLGIGFPRPDAEFDLTTLPGAAALHLEAEQLQDWLEQVRVLVRKERSMFLS